MASKVLGQVGERRGKERMFSTGSRSSEGVEVGELKVSPFFRVILGTDCDGDACSVS